MCIVRADERNKFLQVRVGGNFNRNRQACGKAIRDASGQAEMASPAKRSDQPGGFDQRRIDFGGTGRKQDNPGYVAVAQTCDGVWSEGA